MVRSGVYPNPVPGYRDFPSGPMADSMAQVWSHMPQLRVYMLQLKILHARKTPHTTTKTWYSQIYIYKQNIKKKVSHYFLSLLKRQVIRSGDQDYLSEA